MLSVSLLVKMSKRRHRLLAFIVPTWNVTLSATTRSPSVSILQCAWYTASTDHWTGGWVSPTDMFVHSSGTFTSLPCKSSIT